MQNAHSLTRGKKWIAGIGSLLALTMLAAGCDSSTSSGGDNSNQTTYTINQDVPSGDVNWKVTEVKDLGNKLSAKASRYPTIAKDKTTGGKYLQVSISVENKGKDLASITSPKLLDKDGKEYTDISSQVTEWVPEGKELYLLSNLNPNLPKDFVIFYEVPATASGFQLKVGVLKPQTINLGL